MTRTGEKIYTVFFNSKDQDKKKKKIQKQTKSNKKPYYGRVSSTLTRVRTYLERVRDRVHVLGSLGNKSIFGSSSLLFSPPDYLSV